MKTTFALAVALAMLAPGAQAATFDLPSGGSMFIAGRPITGIETAQISIHVDAVVGPNMRNPFDGSPLPSFWFGTFTASTPLSNFAVGLGQCSPGCGGFLSTINSFGTLNISDAARTIVWAFVVDQLPQNFSGITPHITLSLPDGLSLTAVPLPAALPLFAAGLGMVAFVARRRKRAA